PRDDQHLLAVGVGAWHRHLVGRCLPTHWLLARPHADPRPCAAPRRLPAHADVHGDGLREAGLGVVCERRVQRRLPGAAQPVLGPLSRLGRAWTYLRGLADPGGGARVVVVGRALPRSRLGPLVPTLAFAVHPRVSAEPAGRPTG